ncbi:hypothetical protein V490_06218 [Pseudogymnoascus sp. VKM F-3557]|nr:hypothetical protein V490_06218 [Pseudogymnoascus sp. VKM F-3557]
MAATLTLPLLNKLVNLEDALRGDDDVLSQLRHPQERDDFFSYLESHTPDIKTQVCAHLGVSDCHVCIMSIWRSGSFNVCVPVILPIIGGDQEPSTVYVRFPLPYKLGEDRFPGNIDEKLRAEVATYIWLQENSPDVPIPILHGFGLPDGQCFTHPNNAPLFSRATVAIKRAALSLFGFPAPCKYVQRELRNPFKSGYVILSEAKGDQLNSTWEIHRHDQSYQSRLFRGLARVSLSMNKAPLPRIGSLMLDSNGVISLSNRPLNLYFHKLENEGIPSGIPRQRTYGSVESYLSDFLSFHDNKIRFQPNAIHSKEDAEMQIAALTGMRATMHRFIRPEYRDGPFFLTLTDMHRSNIFVDEQWNIQAVIDLEWACSQPVEMQLPPYWLTSRSVDDFTDPESIVELDGLLKEYFDIYAEEELAQNGRLYHSPIMRHVWHSGSFWYFQAATIPKGMYLLFSEHVQPLFNKEHCEKSIFDKVFWWYWGVDVKDVVERKLKDKEKYTADLKRAFGVEEPIAAADVAVKLEENIGT